MRFGGSLRDARRAHGDGHEGRRSAAAVLVLVLLAAGCGGEGSRTPSDSVAKAAASATPGSTRAVTADVDGRKLSGHCAGTQPEGSPAIVFESGSGDGQNQLADIEQRFTDRTLVCAYDRAGVGGSDPPAKTPRPVSELVADLDAFLAAADAHPPYLLVGQSMGGNIVLMYAQAHPEKVAGFVSMNPVPPAETWLKAIRKVVSKRDFATERSYFHRGEGADNPEHTSFV